MTWRDDAACRHADPDLFFPERGESTAPARAICLTCPVFDACFEEGLYQKFGIWGGTSERDRRKIRKARGIRLHDDIEDSSLEESA